MRILDTSVHMSMDLLHTAVTHTCSFGSTRTKFANDFKRLYLRVGSLAIAPRLPSTLMEEEDTLRSTLIALCICLRFIRTQKCVKERSSVSARLSGLLTYWTKKYDEYTMSALLQELFGTLHLENSLIYQFRPLLRVDFSRNLKDITTSFILSELYYTELVYQSLPTPLKSSKVPFLIVVGCALGKYTISVKALLPNTTSESPNSAVIMPSEEDTLN